MKTEGEEMKKPLVARKISYKQSDADLYETPTKITEMIMNRIEIEEGAIVYEPADGRGAISQIVRNYGFRCDTSDIMDGVDFLKTQGSENYDMVITNPPYKYAKEFVIKSLEHVRDGGLVVMLLRLSFLESAKRYHFFKDSGLLEVHISSKRITMYPANGNIPKNSGTVAYAWFVWKKNFKGYSTLHWFNN